jgi:hypothetical protein
LYKRERNERSKVAILTQPDEHFSEGGTMHCATNGGTIGLSNRK